MYCLVNEGKKKRYKYWAILESNGDLIACYGSLDDMDISLSRAKDMKAQEIRVKKLNPHKDMLRRVRKKFDEGYETASSDIEKAIKTELNRRYDGTLFDLEEREESSPKSSDSTHKIQNKQKQDWKPSDDFAWF